MSINEFVSFDKLRTNGFSGRTRLKQSREGSFTNHRMSSYTSTSSVRTGLE